MVFPVDYRHTMGGCLGRPRHFARLRDRRFEHPRPGVEALSRPRNRAAGAPHFCYDQTMTIGITGPERKVPRQSALVGLIIAAAVIGICLILLWLASDFLVDWLWFSSIGYLQVFWTTIGAKAAVFLAVWTGTAVILWLNG